MAIPQEIVDRVREQSDLVEIASEFVSLKRAGRNFTACCPFHDEKTPSFNVNAEEGFYKCFGCGKKGDVFSFLMEMRSWSFPETVRFLANRLGIEIPQSAVSGKSESNSKRNAVLRRVTAAIEQCYVAALREQQIGARAREYLTDRGLTEETVSTFRLGYAPDRWEFLPETLEAVFSKSDDSLSPEQLKLHCQQLGLIKERSGGERGFYDLFRDRIVFPIARSDGCPIAFGARLLRNKKDAPKYLNSSENPLYLKRRSLYGLPQALPSLRQERLVYLVEGYTDVLSLHQVGVRNVLASCGTALTDEHAQVVKRLVDRVVVLFDGDAAGRKAAAGCFERFLNTAVAVRVAFLPPGEDPDSMARRVGAEAVRRLAEQQARPVVDVYVEQLMEAEGIEPGGRTGEAALRGKVAAQFAAQLARVINPVEREVLQRRGCELLGVGEEALRALIAEVPKPRPKTKQSRPSMQLSEYVEVRPLSAPPPDLDEPPLPGDEGVLSAPAPRSDASSESQGVLHEYVRQLLVSVIAEPTQSELVLKTPSLLDGGGVIEKLPQAAAVVLRSLTEGQYEGVLSLVAQPDESEQRIEGLERLRRLLAEQDLPAEELIAEAQRQCSIGGTRREAVVADVARVSARSNLVLEIEQLKNAESRASTAEELRGVVQRKLELRKQLDRLEGDSE